MSNRKWLKWQVGGGVIFSLAVMFNTAKAGPEFVKAIQAAQDTSNAADMDDENKNDQDNVYTDADNANSDQEIKSNSELALAKEEPQKHSPAITPPPVLAETRKSKALAHSVDQPTKKMAAPSKKQPAHKQISKQDSVTSATAVSKSLKAANTQSTQQSVKPSHPVPVPANNQAPAPAAEPPADIPVVPPTEDTNAAPTDSIAVNAESDESTDQSQTQTSTKKTSHSKSHRS